MSAYPANRFFSGPNLIIAEAIEQGRALPDLSSVADTINLPGVDGMTLLMFAVLQSRNSNSKAVAAARALVNAGADPLQEIDDLGSPLFVLIRSNDVQLMRAFLSGGMDPNVRIGGLPLVHELAMTGSLACLQAVVEAGANLESTDSLGRTALDRAIAAMQFDHAEFLLDRGANPHATSVNGVSVSYKLYNILSRQQAGSPAHRKLTELRDRMIGMGAKWPPAPPPAVD